MSKSWYAHEEGRIMALYVLITALYENAMFHGEGELKLLIRCPWDDLWLSA